jgi:hypothetical protein
MNTKRIVVLVAGSVLAILLVSLVFSLASPDAIVIRDVTTGETQVVYGSAADRERAEQLEQWSRLASGIVMLAAVGAFAYGTRPGRWLRVESAPSPAPSGGGR